MQLHKYSSCHSLITSKSRECRQAAEQITVLWQHFFPPNFISVLPSLHRKREKKKKRKRKGQLILFFAYSLTCKLWSELPLQQKDKADFPTQHHAGQEHMPNSSTHFFGNRFSVFGEVPVATPNPILSNTHTHTHTSQEV